jgi:hypothetical protein
MSFALRCTSPDRQEVYSAVLDILAAEREPSSAALRQKHRREMRSEARKVTDAVLDTLEEQSQLPEDELRGVIGTLIIEAVAAWLVERVMRLVIDWWFSGYSRPYKRRVQAMSQQDGGPGRAA